jgi:hypothetical protein
MISHGSESSGTAALLAFQGAAEHRAAKLGHDVGPWVAVEGEPAARTARCTACGAVAYLRTEGGLVGVAGALCSVPCGGVAPEPG